MSTDQPDPHDDKVTNVPLPTEEGHEVIAQENMSPEVALGGGEWPPTDSPPRGPAPGDAESDHTAAGDAASPRRGGAGEFPPMKEVLHVDPVSGGSQAVPPGGKED